jgi:PhzF family phenazine biosynthesis protein
MSIQIYHVDAFTERPFSGNPAAVCLLPAPRETKWMQAVAAEMNLSETAFLVKEDDVYQLSWFTPKVEVDLCGHATLAAAHVLWSEIGLPNLEPLQFETRSGRLTAARQGTLIELDFPLEPASPTEPPPGLMEALGVTADYVGKNRFDYLVEVGSEDELRAIRPDFAALAKIEVRGVIVTSRAASSEYDFSSRFFAPLAGIDEDPVTGSAHCCLGPFWRERFNKSTFIARQLSSRGGVVYVRVTDDRALLGGQAITIVRGELCPSGLSGIS